MNNVNRAKVLESKLKAQNEPTALQFPLNLSGEWRMDESLPQFGGTVKIANGESVSFETDFPIFLGGGGRKPTPLQYCFWGGMSCLASTLAVNAALEGVELRSMKLKTSGTIDFRQAVGLPGGDPIQGLTLEVEVETDASDEELERLMQLSEERCPASWMLKNIVPFTARIRKA